MVMPVGLALVDVAGHEFHDAVIVFRSTPLGAHDGKPPPFAVARPFADTLGRVVSALGSVGRIDNKIDRRLDIGAVAGPHQGFAESAALELDQVGGQRRQQGPQAVAILGQRRDHMLVRFYG